jgi:hypothetical protein
MIRNRASTKIEMQIFSMILFRIYLAERERARDIGQMPMRLRGLVRLDKVTLSLCLSRVRFIRFFLNYVVVNDMLASIETIGVVISWPSHHIQAFCLHARSCAFQLDFWGHS